MASVASFPRKKRPSKPFASVFTASFYPTHQNPLWKKWQNRQGAINSHNRRLCRCVGDAELSPLGPSETRRHKRGWALVDGDQTALPKGKNIEIRGHKSLQIHTSTSFYLGIQLVKPPFPRKREFVDWVGRSLIETEAEALILEGLYIDWVFKGDCFVCNVIIQCMSCCFVCHKVVALQEGLLSIGAWFILLAFLLATKWLHPFGSGWRGCPFWNSLAMPEKWRTANVISCWCFFFDAKQEKLPTSRSFR